MDNGWLLPFVPLIVLPIVLLFAFAGCTVLFPLEEHQVSLPDFAAGGSPLCTISETGVTCDGSMVRLSNEAVALQLDVTGDARFDCRAGNRLDPAPNPVGFSGTATKFENPDAAGILQFSVAWVIGSDPNSPDPQKAGCKNSTPVLDPTATVVKSITLTISQNGRLLFTCTDSGAFPVGQKAHLNCHRM
jgi:hypothetical protein